MDDLEDRYKALALRLEGRSDEEWLADPEVQALIAERGEKQVIADIRELKRKVRLDTGRHAARGEQLRTMLAELEDEQKKARPDWGRLRALGEQLLGGLEDEQEVEQLRALLAMLEDLEDDEEAD